MISTLLPKIKIMVAAFKPFDHTGSLISVGCLQPLDTEPGRGDHLLEPSDPSLVIVE